MLGLPGAFVGTGWLGGILLLVVGATLSSHGLILLAKSATLSGLPSSFYTVAHAAVPQYTVLIDAAVALKCFGVATGYLITVGDCMVDACHQILSAAGDDDGGELNFVERLVLSRRFWVTAAVFGVLPLSFHTTLDSLKHTSALALVFVFFTVLGIVAYYLGLVDPCEGYGDEICIGEIAPLTDMASTFRKIPIFIFAFTCQQNVFPVVNEIKDRSKKRIFTVIVAAILGSLLIFLIVAIYGYGTYGSLMKGDIVLNYPETSNVTIMRICIASMLILHYPLQLDPSRRCILTLVSTARRFFKVRRECEVNAKLIDYVTSSKHSPFAEFSNADNVNPGVNYGGLNTVDHGNENNVGGNTGRVAVQSVLDEGTAVQEKDLPFYVITISFLLFSFFIAMVESDLGLVLSLVGATGSTLVSYVLPGLIYVKLHEPLDASKICAYIQLGLGCFIMPTALYFIL
eukprot:CAMPEP_0194316166 /NCGR_PEP_ID=MMETSP0171-20130528/12981_1 /TAXON_ID=218684 /ORGANISM="Corethron pennatum, Strain L29A3" /LENGTH=457 /DNA_ID=CAMNT_0039072313 /DNA_START=218 /DNA_END=1588 /DNA_ORIENTATION=-